MIDLDKILSNFEMAAIRHAEATEEGDFKTANRNHSIIIREVQKLRQGNLLQRLEYLLSNEEVGVKLWSATFLLPSLEDKALKVLEDIAKGESIHAFTAEVTIEEWKKGRLNLDA